MVKKESAPHPPCFQGLVCSNKLKKRFCVCRQKVKRQCGVCVMTRCGILAVMAVILYYIDIWSSRFKKAGLSLNAAGDFGGLCDGAAAGRGGGRHQESGAHARHEHGLRGEMADIIMSKLFHHPGQPDLPPPQGQKERGALDGGRHGADDDCGVRTTSS